MQATPNATSSRTGRPYYTAPAPVVVATRVIDTSTGIAVLLIFDGPTSNGSNERAAIQATTAAAPQLDTIARDCIGQTEYETRATIADAFQRIKENEQRHNRAA